MKYSNGDVYEGEFSNDKMHGEGVFEYATGDLLKSTGEWKDGKKFGEFEDIPRPKPVKVYYDENGDVKSEVKVKREAVCLLCISSCAEMRVHPSVNRRVILP